MKVLVFDIETNNFLDKTNTIHSLVIKDPATGEFWSCSDRSSMYTPVQKGLDFLASADVIVGHNIIGFDLPAIWKLYPEWGSKFKPGGTGIVRDTMILARLLWPSEVIKDKDFRLAERGALPRNLIGTYSLEAFGYRLGNYKGDFKGSFEEWSFEMQEYCEQDVRVTEGLWKLCLEDLLKWGLEAVSNGLAPGTDSVELEHEVAFITTRQERYGFAFNVEAAARLYARLTNRHAELAAELNRSFLPETIRTPFTPKKDNKPRGYVKGVTIYREKVVLFNPSSRPQVAERLKRLGWVPRDFTDNGQPTVDDEVLNSLDYPEAKVLAEYYMLEKRLGQLGDGRQAWLKAERNGRIHGRVITNGAVTGRMTHSSPNIAQVPGITDKKTGQPLPFGKDCRELFTASRGKVLVGCDADALELRDLAGFMAWYDKGAYIETVLRGSKSEGTDMHTLNALALSCTRDVAKVWFYAFIYGAGDLKLGTILGAAGSDRRVMGVGKLSREKFLKALPALNKLVKAVKARAKERKFLLGLDGRRLRVRSDHAALNTLLQSAGAIQMKRALVILDYALRASGLIPGIDYEFVANVHDEWQIDCSKECAEFVGKEAEKAIALAGEFYNFKCPLAGNASIGETWAGTH